MKKRLKLDKSVNRSIVLCETTSFHAGKMTSKRLTEDSVSFTKSWRHIPFFRREDYHGADQVCVFSINRNEYSKARKSIDRLEYPVRDRIVLNVI